MRAYRLRDEKLRFDVEDARDLFRQMHESSLWNRDMSLDLYIVSLAGRAANILGHPLGAWTTEEDLLDRLIQEGLIDKEA